jgi:hypothetical protein
MYRNGQIQASRQTTLLNKSLTLLGDKLLTPIVVQTNLSHGAEVQPLGWSSQILLYQRQLLAPTSILVHRRRMQAHHRTAKVGVFTRKGEQTLVALAIYGGQQKSLYATLTGTLYGLGAIRVKLLGVKV